MTDGDPFGVVWAPRAVRDLERMPEKVGTAVVEFVYGPLAANPPRVGHALRFELEGAWSANRGDHRIVYRSDGARREVTVLAVDHRSRVYRSR